MRAHTRDDTSDEESLLRPTRRSASAFCMQLRAFRAVIVLGVMVVMLVVIAYHRTDGSSPSGAVNRAAGSAAAALASTPEEVAPTSAAHASSFRSTISPHLDICWRNPFMAAITQKSVEEFETHYSAWWASRSSTLFRVLTEYYHHPLVHPEQPGDDDYDQLKASTAPDGIQQILYDEQRPFPCPYGGISRIFNPASGEAQSEAKMVCGLAQYDDIVAQAKVRFPDLFPAVGVEADDSECIVYSLGSNNQFSFEEALSTMTKCSTWTFDCTSDAPKSVIARLYFEKVCLGSDEFNGSGKNLQLKTFPMIHTPPGWLSQQARPYLERMEFTTYNSIVSDRLKHSHVTLLKMDVEGGEYGVVADMLSNPKFAASQQQLAPFQITMELHWWNRGVAHAMLSLDMINQLYRSGYRVMKHEQQNDRSCFEVSLLRVFC